MEPKKSTYKKGGPLAKYSFYKILYISQLKKCTKKIEERISAKLTYHNNPASARLRCAFNYA
jgi:hypothetical protein